MNTSDIHRHDRVANAIREMASSSETRRYTAALPQFEVDSDLPEDMTAMLKQMEKLKKTRGN